MVVVEPEASAVVPVGTASLLYPEFPAALDAKTRYAYFFRLFRVVSEKALTLAATWAIFVQVLLRLLVIRRSITNPDSLLELSVQDRFTRVEVASTATKFEGAAGIVGLGVGVGVGVAVGVVVGVAAGVGVGVAVGVAVGVGVNVGVGVGLAYTEMATVNVSDASVLSVTVSAAQLSPAC